MNETGRMPGFCMVHIGMSMRLTQTTEGGVVVVDATGLVKGIEFHDDEPVQNKEALELPGRPLVVLRKMPKAIYLELDECDGVAPLHLISPRPCHSHVIAGFDPECQQCASNKNVVAIAPFKNRSAWTLEVKVA